METTDSPLIYPAVKRTVAWLAGLAASLALTGAALSLLALLALLTGLHAYAFPCCDASLFMERLLAVVLSLLAPWCHSVLLAGRGNDITRWLAWFCVYLGGLILVCTLYTALTFELLLPRQDDVLLMLFTLMLSILLFNLPRMVAASVRCRTALILALLMLTAAELTELPALILLPNAAFKIAAAALLVPLLLQLRRLAPRIISMPGPAERNSPS